MFSENKTKCAAASRSENCVARKLCGNLGFTADYSVAVAQRNCRECALKIKSVQHFYMPHMSNFSVWTVSKKDLM